MRKKDLYAHREFQKDWMCSDIKPTGRNLKRIKHASRQKAKKEIAKEVKNGRK